MELLDFYKQLLGAAGVAVDDDGCCYQLLDDTKVPTTVMRKFQLRLPNKEFLRNPDWSSYVAFHPMSEQAHRGESEVIKRMRQLIRARFNHTAVVLTEFLARLAADNSKHKRLGAKASEFLTLMPKATEKTAETVGKILDKVGEDNSQTLVNLYLKRPGHYKGQKYHRVCVVTFPVFAAMDDDARTIFGVKCNVGDYTAIKNLFQYVFNYNPDDGDKDAQEAYNYATNSQTTPYLECLYGSWFKLAKRFNQIIRLFQNVGGPEISSMEFDTSWESELENLASYQRLLEPLEYNMGSASPDEKKEPVQAPVAPARHRSMARMSADTVRAAPVHSQQPMVEEVHEVPVRQQAAPVKEEPTGVKSMSLAEMKRIAQQKQPPQPQYQQQPAMYPQAGYPQYAQVNPGYPVDPNAGWFGTPPGAPAPGVAVPQAPVIHQNGVAYTPFHGGQPVQQAPMVRGHDGRFVPAAPQPAYGYNQPVDQYGRPIVQPVDQYGRPIVQQPVDQWGRPVMQPQYPMR